MHNNDFDPGQGAEVRYPLTREQHDGDRAAWPWLNGIILEQVGPDEYMVCVEADEVAAREDGSPPRPGDPTDELIYPTVFRDASELRPA